MQTKRNSPTPTIPHTRLIHIGHGKFTTVDAHNYPALSQFTWRQQKSHSNTYVARKVHHYGKTKTILIHRQIMQPLPDQQVHHINGDPLDNREVNLRNVTDPEHAAINALNRISKKPHADPQP